MSRRLLSSLVFSLVAALSSSAFADGPTPFAPHTSVGTTVRFAVAPPRADAPGLRADAPAVAHVADVADRAAIRARLAANRAANLARFRAYQRKGVFPNNTFTDGALNVWLDRAGHLCAAATLIQQSGHAALVAQVGAEQNFIRLADVTDGPLLDWMLTSGFTQDEIATIQEPFMPVMHEPVLEPQPAPILANRRLRRAEDRRLVAKYRQIDAMLVKQRAASLDLAVDRLMAHPDLARTLLGT